MGLPGAPETSEQAETNAALTPMAEAFGENLERETIMTCNEMMGQTQEAANFFRANQEKLDGPAREKCSAYFTASCDANRWTDRGRVLGPTPYVKGRIEDIMVAILDTEFQLSPENANQLPDKVKSMNNRFDKPKLKRAKKRIEAYNKILAGYRTIYDEAKAESDQRQEAARREAHERRMRGIEE